MKRWCYWNAKGFGIAVVSVVSMWPLTEDENSEKPGDWAAYIGATEGEQTREQETVECVAAYGCKLPKKIACAFFPQFAKIPYRY